MFQICTGDAWASEIARPMVETPDGSLDAGNAIFFVSFIVVVGWTLLQVVVAVLLDNFTEASNAEKQRGEATLRQVLWFIYLFLGIF